MLRCEVANRVGVPPLDWRRGGENPLPGSGRQQFGGGSGL